MNEDGTTKAIESQAWPLCCRYLFVTLTSLPVQVWEKGIACNRRVRWAIGLLSDGQYESLGVWPESVANEDAWKATLEDMRVRGVETIRFVVSDEIVALQPVLNEAYPQAKLLLSPPQRGRAVVAREYALQELQRRAGRSIRRHGCFVDMQGATAFITYALMRAEWRISGTTSKANRSVGRVVGPKGQTDRATSKASASS